MQIQDREEKIPFTVQTSTTYTQQSASVLYIFYLYLRRREGKMSN